MKRKHRDFSNISFIWAVAQYVHSDRDRKMLVRFYVDDATYDDLCNEFHLSLSQVKRIIFKQGMIAFNHMDQT